MEKVYIVYGTYHEHDDIEGDVYNAESVERLFDSEEKAVDYIREAIKRDHERVDTIYPDDECMIKHSPDDKQIRESIPVMSYEYKSITYICMHYRFESYVVE